VEKILVVDDDRSTRHLIELQLRGAGFSVASEADGVAALARLEREACDLVLLDIWMPEMDGLELMERLRQLETPPRVIVMTADDAPETLLKALRGRACRYVTKPVEPAVLVALVQEVLASEPEKPIEVISAKADWVEMVVPCDRRTAERIQGFLAQLDADLPEDVRSGVGQAFRELLNNAIEWGGGLDPDQTVRIAYLRAKRMLLYRISDPGRGFSFERIPHAAVSNPADNPMEHAAVREEQGLRPGGFGLVLTRAMVDELLYNEEQNEVVFVKYLD
jgi:CheY-like chemotaxis protein/anti-sigma regulatory factor (Ser/Thr protein kinase)